jgi:hypothetical protein
MATVTTTVNVLPQRAYPAGTRVLPATAVPLGIVRLTLTLARLGWPDIGGDVLRASVELSLDGGQTWTPWVGFTTGGGDIGMPASSVTIDVPEPTNPQRMLRGQVETLVGLTTRGDLLLVADTAV